MAFRPTMTMNHRFCCLAIFFNIAMVLLAAPELSAQRRFRRSQPAPQVREVYPQQQSWARQMFTEFEHDFGTVAKNEFAEHRFQIKNVFNQDIQIARVKTSCSCTSTRLTKNVIKPGETGELVAVFNTRNFVGQKQATVSVVFAAPSATEVQLTVKGNIRSDVMFQPGNIDFGSLTPDAIAKDQTAKKIQITKFNNPNWRIVDVKSTFEHVGVKLSAPVQVGNQIKYDMSVRIKESAPAGYVKNKLVIIGEEFGRRSEIPISFSAKVASALQVSPEILTITSVGEGEVIEKKVIVKADQPFKINDVKCVNDAFSVQADTEKNSKVHFVKVVYTAETKPGRYEYELEFITDLNKSASQTIKAVVEIAAKSESDQ